MKFLRRVAVIAALFAPAAIGAAPAQAQSEPRHYDCSKAGNADKAVCKEAAAANQAPASDSSDGAKTRHYDCTKPGNADKEVCKAAAANSAPAATQASSDPTRHYDCTKPGNADKEACKTAAAQPSGSQPAASTPATAQDCSHWYDKLLDACKAPGASAATPASAAKPAASSGGDHAAATHGSRENDDPNGAIAQCKDGKYSHAAHRDGACSDHGGVAKWLSD
jgi:hypothetical protein